MSATGQRVLIVEDEPQLAHLLEDYLEQSGYQTAIIHDGSQVSQSIRGAEPDLILLDVMLPGVDGMTLCKQIREFSQVPVIMVTARFEESDRLRGLELGADDYICKPFSPREVVARVKAVLRRSAEGVKKIPPTLKIDEARFKAELHGQDLELTAVEFQLLKILSADPGRIYSRSQLMDQIYNDHRIVSDRTIDSHIKKLRKKIAAVSPGEELIYSVYGVGYKFEC
jgi:two-component system response regulator BaeR